MDATNTIYTACVSLTLDRFSDDQIAAMNNALTGFDRLAPQNIAYPLAVECDLVNADGYPRFDMEVLLSALSLQVHKRPAFGLVGKS